MDSLILRLKPDWWSTERYNWAKSLKVGDMVAIPTEFAKSYYVVKVTQVDEHFIWTGCYIQWSKCYGTMIGKRNNFFRWTLRPVSDVPVELINKY